MAGKGNNDISGGNKHVASKRKAGGVLRHPMLTLKKVARLPSKDRQEVLKVLKKFTNYACVETKSSK